MSTTSIPGGGNHNVTVYGNGTVIAGSGNDSVRLGSGYVLVGNGRDTISVQRNGTVSAGSGNDQIAVLGSGQVSVGGGNDTITLRGSGQIVQTGVSGHDTINLGGGNNDISVQGNATVHSSNYFVRFGFGGGHGVPNTFFGAGTFGGATVAGGDLQVNHLPHGVTQDIAVSGTMTLVGGHSRTEFVGGTGSTVMKGGSGHDTFIGGTGHDTMTGSGTHNVFEFLASAQGGNHVITNFVSGDELNVDGHSLSYLLANNQVTTHNGNTYISADGGKTTIELQGVTLQHAASAPPFGPQTREVGSHGHGPVASGGAFSSGLGGHGKPELEHQFHDRAGKPY